MIIFRSTRRDGTDNAANRRATVAAGYLPVFFALAATQTALASLAAIEQPTMAATLTRMERDSLIHRRPDPQDGRSSLISLTPVALKKVNAVEAAADVLAESTHDHDDHRGDEGHEEAVLNG